MEFAEASSSTCFFYTTSPAKKTVLQKKSTLDSAMENRKNKQKALAVISSMRILAGGLFLRSSELPKAEGSFDIEVGDLESVALRM